MISFGFLLLLLKFSAISTVTYSDYSVSRCQKGASLVYQCIGLWYSSLLKLPAFPCKVDVIKPCEKQEYAEINDAPIHHIHIDFKTCENQPCALTSESPSASPLYTTELESSSIAVNLKAMRVITGITVHVLQMAGNTLNYTIHISPHGVNWEPLLDKGKLMVINSLVNNGSFCLTKKLFGKFLQIKFNKDDIKINASIDIYVANENGTNITNGTLKSGIKPTKTQFKGCYQLYQNNYVKMVHSGLTISQAVNLDDCLLHCSILSFSNTLVINAVQCVCTNSTIYGSDLHQYYCDSPYQINNVKAINVFSRILRTLPEVQFTNQVVLHESFKTNKTYPENEKYTIYYDLGDGNKGKTCEMITHRYRSLGQFSVIFNVFNEFGDNNTIEGQVSVVDPPVAFHVFCPMYVALNTNFSCHVTLSRGSNVTLTVQYDEVTIKHTKLPDSRYYEIGENPKDATEATGNDTIVFVGYPVKDSGMLLGIELSLAKAGPMRLMILRKPDVPIAVVPDQSTNEEKGTTCNTEMFVFDTQACCLPTVGCHSQPGLTEDLSRYHYSHEIILGEYLSTGYNYVPIPSASSVVVVKGDIIVVRQDAETGLLAKLNKTRNTTTALVFPTGIESVLVGDMFKSGITPVTTKEMFALNLVSSSNISQQTQYSYTQIGTFDVKLHAQSPVSAILTQTRSIIVQEKIHSVNVSIARRGLVNRISTFDVEAFGTDLTMFVMFGDNTTALTLSSIGPIQHQYKTKGTFEVFLVIYNKVSYFWMHCKYETIMPVDGLIMFPCNEGVIYGPNVTFRASITSGDYVNMTTNLGDGSEEHVTSGISVKGDFAASETNHTHPHLGAYNVTVFATNGLSNGTTQCIIYVEIPIVGFNISNISTIVNTENNVSISVIPQGGSNHTYNATLNGKEVEVRCVDDYCREAEILLNTGDYPAGINDITVCVFNRVTNPLCETATFTAYDSVKGFTLEILNFYLVDQPINVSLTFQNGSDVSCFLWIQGFEGFLQQCRAGFVMTKSITCTTPGFYKVAANCSNVLSFGFHQSNFTCMYPVNEIVLTSNSPQSTVTGMINFTLSHLPPFPSNASCYLDFGDKNKEFIKECIHPLNFSHKYSSEGDFLVNATMYNKLTINSLVTYVKIESPVEVIVLKIVRSPCDPMYGQPGGGELQNMFPIECPMIFRIDRMDGTRPFVEWNFGDNVSFILNNTVLALSHTCAVEGQYNFTVRAFNRISSLSAHLIYECRPSIKCTISEDSPFLTSQPANLSLYITNPDFLTAALIDFGDGNLQVIGTSARKSDFPGIPYKVLEPMTKNITLTHLFAKEGEFKVYCNASNSVSHYEFLDAVVISLHKPCRKPIVEIMNVGRFSNMSHLRNETREHDLVIATHNIIDCEASRETIFQWKVYLHHGSGAIDTLLEHPSWKLNASKLIIPKQTLPLGKIRFEFLLRMIHQFVKGVFGRTYGYITVLPTPPKVFIQQGVRYSQDINGQKTVRADFIDVDAPPGNITDVVWLWFAKTDNESLPNNDLGNLTSNTVCFGYPTGILPFSSSSFEYNASLITTRRNCHLKVIATRANRAATYEQDIEFFPVLFLPNLNIVCKINCEEPNPVEILSYEGVSLNVDYTELDFEWKLRSEGKTINLDGKTLTGHRSRNLVFKAGSLEGGRSYRLLLFAWKKGDEQNKGYIEMDFKTNDIPYGGECYLEPSLGYAVITSFHVKCFGWKDKDLPISYRVTIDSDIERFLFSNRLLDQPIYLPFHPGSNTTSLDINVYVTDYHGNYNLTTVSAKVNSSENVMQYIKEAIKLNGHLGNDILGGNTQLATQLLSSIASSILYSADKAGNDTGSITERIEFLVDVATQIPCQTPEDVLSIAGSLVELTVEPSLLNRAILSQATSLIDNMQNVLLESKNLASVELREQASNNILTIIGSILMGSSLHLSKDISNNSSITEAKRITESLFRSMDSIFDILYSDVVMGQDYRVLDTPHLSLLTGLKSFDELDKSPLVLKQSSFLLPKLKTFYSTLNVTSAFPIRIEMSAAKANPFLWTSTAKQVESDVIALDIGSQSGESLPIKNLTRKIRIEIENKHSESKSYPQIYSSKVDHVSTHQINVTINDSSIHGAVNTINCTVPLKLTIRRNEYDCSTNYDYLWILPRNDTPTGIDPFSFFVSNVQLNRTAAGVYFLCIKPLDNRHAMQNCSGYLKYTISTYTGSCRYWDGEENRWTGDGCEVAEPTSTTKSHCLCDHLTSFGGGFFVAPNPIDFGKVLDGFADLSSNPTVFAVIISIFGLYLLLIIWARKADLKDSQKAGVTILADNDHRDTISYEITVYTGFNQSAGTTADVYLRLIGSLGDSEPRILKDPERPRFQRGAVDKFLFTVPQTLGNIREVHIWHNNAGKSPGWFLFRMQIRDCQTQKKWWFVSNKWLAVDEDDGKVERRIKVATKSELTQFNILFINATRRNLLDGHLWLSVYTRPPHSTFTRVQRLSCCLSLIVSTMLANAMFYQTDGGANDTTIKLGPITLSWKLIIISIESSMVVMPVNVLLVTIFRKLAPKEHKAKKFEEDIDIEKEVKGLVLEHNENEEREEVIQSDKEENSSENTKKKKFMFPYWCIYVAYILCFFSSITCALFTIFYGLTFGKDKSEKWLSAMFISFFQSVIVIQPFKVFLLGLFFALIIKDPNKEEGSEADYEPGEESSKGSGAIDDDRIVKKILYSKPPGKEKLEQARALRLKEKQMLAIIREIILHFMVVVVVLFVAYGNHDDKSYSYSKRAIELLTEPIPAFTKIRNDRDYWHWAKKRLIPNLYPVDDLIGYPYTDIMQNNKKSTMVGVGRLRQLRNKQHTCKVPMIFTGEFEDCTEGYSWSNGETRDFAPGWKLTKQNPTNTSLKLRQLNKNPWQYQSAWEIKGFPYFGKMATYQGGGYIMELGPTNNTALETLSNLSKSNWIDQYTRGIFTEINIYSVDVNLLCVITLLYEFLPSGGGVTTINVQTIKLFRYQSSVSKAVMGFEVIFLLLVFYWIYRDCKKIISEGRQYWKVFWNVIDSLTTSLAMCSVGMYFARLVFIFKAVDQFHQNRQKYVCFQYVILLNEILDVLTASVVMLCNMKFLRLMRFNRKISVLTDTLRYSSKMILSFFVMIFFVIFAFCALATLVFGSVLEEYRTIIRSMVSLFSMMLGQFDFSSIHDSNRIIGPVMFFIFMVLVQFVLVNMFIGILSDSFNTVRLDSKKQSNEYEIVDFMVNRLSGLFGTSSETVKPNYKWPKTSLEMQVEMIDEKTDVIMDYMRILSDEDLRTAFWLESDKSVNKKNKIISFALNTQHLDHENDLFDSIPVLLRKLDKIDKEDLLKLSRKEFQSEIPDDDSSLKPSSSISFVCADILDEDKDSVEGLSQANLTEIDEISQSRNEESISCDVLDDDKNSIKSLSQVNLTEIDDTSQDRNYDKNDEVLLEGGSFDSL